MHKIYACPIADQGSTMTLQVGGCPYKPDISRGIGSRGVAGPGELPAGIRTTRSSGVERAPISSLPSSDPVPSAQPQTTVVTPDGDSVILISRYPGVNFELSPISSSGDSRDAQPNVSPIAPAEPPPPATLSRQARAAPPSSSRLPYLSPEPARAGMQDLLLPPEPVTNTSSSQPLAPTPVTPPNLRTLASPPSLSSLSQYGSSSPLGASHPQHSQTHPYLTPDQRMPTPLGNMDLHPSQRVYLPSVGRGDRMRLVPSSVRAAGYTPNAGWPRPPSPPPLR